MNSYRTFLLGGGILSILIGCNALTGINDLEVTDPGIAGSAGSGGSSGGSGGAGGAAGETGGAAGETGGAAGQTGGSGGSSGSEGGTGGAGGCPDGWKLCGSDCVDINDPAYGCTESDCQPCDLPNAEARCAGFSCEIDSCVGPWMDCDFSTPGCETPIDDGNDCTKPECGYPPEQAGTVCNQDGGTQCDGTGTCICTQDDRRCFGNQPQVCDAIGGWGDANPCAAPSPICSRGQCVRPVRVVTGAAHTCVMLEDATLRCWGDNSSGQLGIGTVGGYEPAPVAPLVSTVLSVFAGTDHTCAIDSSQGLACWGDNSWGQVGVGSWVNEIPEPTKIDSLSSVQLVSLGKWFSCALGNFAGTDGLYCWGAAAAGQHGIDNASQGQTDAPTQPVGLPSSPVVSLATGGAHACVALADGSLHCWGADSQGCLGTDSVALFTTTPVEITAVPGSVSKVWCGGDHTCALSSNGMHCWGSDRAGQLGDGLSDLLQALPVSVPWDGDPALGGQHTCLTEFDGTKYLLRCWGRNNAGQLGVGTTDDLDEATAASLVLNDAAAPLVAPSPIPGFTQPHEVPVHAHTCAIKSDGNVWCWGSNDLGQLGTGNTSPSSSPVAVVW